MMNKYFTIIFLIISNFSFGQMTEKSEDGSFLIKGATLVTVTNGTIISDLLIEAGIIKKIGKNLVPVDNTVKIVDAIGKYVYPGFIDSGTRLGLSEIGSISLTKDYNEIGDFVPNMKALTAINPNSVNIPVNRVNGITTVLANPTGGLFPGTAALIHLHGYTPDQMYAGFSAPILNFPSTGKRGRWDKRSEEDIKKDSDKALKKLNKIWAKALLYAKIDSAGTAMNRERSEYNPQMDALLGVVRGKTKLLLSVNKEEDIKAAISWVKKNNVNAIFVGMIEAYRVIEEIQEAKIDLIVGPILDNPRRDSDHYDAVYTNPGKLQKAGIRLSIRTNETENVRNLNYNAGFAATYGMGTEEALKAITINAAQIFGVDDQIGSLEEGKLANLFIADGDPFETKTQITELFIKGWKVPLENRHTLLYEEFIERNPGIKE